MKRTDCYKPWCGVEKLCVDCADGAPSVARVAAKKPMRSKLVGNGVVIVDSDGDELLLITDRDALDLAASLASRRDQIQRRLHVPNAEPSNRGSENE